MRTFIQNTVAGITIAFIVFITLSFGTILLSLLFKWLIFLIELVG